MRLMLALACATVAIAAPAEAQTLRHFTVAVTGGTLGIGPEVTYTFNPLLAVRGSATFFGISAHVNANDYHYDGHAHVSNFGGTIDLHPFANGFRISAGARSIVHNNIRVTGSSRINRTFGPVSYTPDQIGSITTTIRAKSIAPLATIGWVHTTLVGITFGFDAGVMFQGKPTAYNFIATGQLATNPLAQAEYADQQRRVNDDVDGYKYYPIAQLSLGYRF